MGVATWCDFLGGWLHRVTGIAKCHMSCRVGMMEFESSPYSCQGHWGCQHRCKWPPWPPHSVSTPPSLLPLYFSLFLSFLFLSFIFLSFSTTYFIFSAEQVLQTTGMKTLTARGVETTQPTAGWRTTRPMRPTARMGMETRPTRGVGYNEGGNGRDGNGNQSKTRYVATTITSPRLTMNFSTTYSGCKGMISFNVYAVYVVCMDDTQLQLEIMVI